MCRKVVAKKKHALVMQAGNSNSAQPRTITRFRPASLVQLIPNTTATHTITYTYIICSTS